MAVIVNRVSEYPRRVTPPYRHDHTIVKSRTFLQWSEQKVPALAVAARAARECDGKDEVERRDLPLVAREVPFDVEPVRLQEVARRVVLAMLVPYALEDRELALRAH